MRIGWRTRACPSPQNAADAMRTKAPRLHLRRWRWRPQRRKVSPRPVLPAGEGPPGAAPGDLQQQDGLTTLRPTSARSSVDTPKCEGGSPGVILGGHASLSGASSSDGPRPLAAARLGMDSARRRSPASCLRCMTQWAGSQKIQLARAMSVCGCPRALAGHDQPRVSFGGRPQEEAPSVVAVRARQAVRRGEVARRRDGQRGPQDESPLGRQERYGEPAAGVRGRGDAVALPQVLPLRVDAVRARSAAVVEAVEAVEAGAVAAHLH